MSLLVIDFLGWQKKREEGNTREGKTDISEKIIKKDCHKKKEETESMLTWRSVLTSWVIINVKKIEKKSNKN